MLIVINYVNKYALLFHIYLDFLTLNLVYFVLEMSWEIKMSLVVGTLHEVDIIH